MNDDQLQMCGSDGMIHARRPTGAQCIKTKYGTKNIQICGWFCLLWTSGTCPNQLHPDKGEVSLRSLDAIPAAFNLSVEEFTLRQDNHPNTPQNTKDDQEVLTVREFPLQSPALTPSSI